MTLNNTGNFITAGIFYCQTVSAVSLTDKSIRQVGTVFPADKSAKLSLNTVLCVFHLLSDFFKTKACRIKKLLIVFYAPSDFFLYFFQGRKLIKSSIKQVFLFFGNFTTAIIFRFARCVKQVIYPQKVSGRKGISVFKTVKNTVKICNFGKRWFALMPYTLSGSRCFVH